MLFNFLVDLFLTRLTDFISIIEINFFEFINLPVGVLDVLLTFGKIAMFFIPTSTYPIFAAIFAIMTVKVIGAAVHAFLATLRLIPFINHFI